MFVYRTVSRSVFIQRQPNQKCRFDGGSKESDRVERRDSMAEQFQQRSSRTQSGRSEMNWQKLVMQKPRRNRGRADQHTAYKCQATCQTLPTQRSKSLRQPKEFDQLRR